MRTVTVQANFSYQASFGSKGPVAYETLLLDSMRGDATLFTRRDEVEAEWRIITPIEEAWAHLPLPELPNYAAGTEGPNSRHELLGIRGTYSILRKNSGVNGLRHKNPRDPADNAGNSTERRQNDGKPGNHRQQRSANS